MQFVENFTNSNLQKNYKCSRALPIFAFPNMFLLLSFLNLLLYYLPIKLELFFNNSVIELKSELQDRRFIETFVTVGSKIVK